MFEIHWIKKQTTNDYFDAMSSKIEKPVYYACNKKYT